MEEVGKRKGKENDVDTAQVYEILQNEFHFRRILS